MGSNESSFTFHLFGNVFLEDPVHFLDDEEYQFLMRYMPLIQELDNSWQHRPLPTWDMNGRFDQLVHEETQAWRQLGVERSPDFLLRPSGSVSAPLALHLLNPTFHTLNPYNTTIYDPSNPTMFLLQEQGFSPDNSLVFDQVCRREETKDVLRFWVDEVQKPHDDFVVDLRRNMSAIVEIFWGENVWRMMQKHCHLVRFPLWGKYQDVRLYLELDGEKLKRFVFWVWHPQFFFQKRRATTIGGISDRTLQARTQDTALELAARLAGVSIRGNFYENFPRYKFPRLKKEAFQVFSSLRESAHNEMKLAFPETFQKEKERLQRLGEKKRVYRQQSQSILSDLEEILENHIQQKHEYNRSSTTNNSNNNGDNELWRLRGQKIKDLAQSWWFSLERTRYDQTDPENPEDSADSGWFSLPAEIINWVQSQDGLKIDGKPIASRLELETAFRLLLSSEETLECGNIEASPIEELVIRVACDYVYFTARKRKGFIYELTVPGTPVIPRKCSVCKSRVLDDAFPIFALNNRNYYVLQTTEIIGCGLPGCKGRSQLVPTNEWQQYSLALQARLENLPNTNGRADWSSFLCRSEEELDGLPKSIQLRCGSCNGPKKVGYPRWTIELDPRFVIPALKCIGCGRRKCYFYPVDSQWETVQSKVLAQVWQEITESKLDQSVVRDAILRKAHFSDVKGLLLRHRLRVRESQHGSKRAE